MFHTFLPLQSLKFVLRLTRM